MYKKKLTMNKTTMPEYVGHSESLPKQTIRSVRFRFLCHEKNIHKVMMTQSPSLQMQITFLGQKLWPQKGEEEEGRGGQEGGKEGRVGSQQEGRKSISIKYGVLYMYRGKRERERESRG